MNLWGFTPSFLKELAQRFPVFLEQRLPQNPAKAEFFLPMAISQLLEEGKASVKVLHSGDKWYGVTYAADKPAVVEALRELTQAGKYPDGSKCLRAKIDMSSPNMNMRDPVIYRILRATHHRTGDTWCIYPMYDYAHPICDYLQGVTH